MYVYYRSVTSRTSGKLHSGKCSEIKAGMP